MKSCLVVDDSKVIRMVARRILEELNFEVLPSQLSSACWPSAASSTSGWLESRIQQLGLACGTTFP